MVWDSCLLACPTCASFFLVINEGETKRESCTRIWGGKLYGYGSWGRCVRMEKAGVCTVSLWEWVPQWQSVDAIKPDRFSHASIYMLSVTVFDPKGAISEVRVHAHCGAGALFGYTGCWSIAKWCSWFSTKFSRSLDHHGKTKEELKKIVSKNEK